MALEREFCKWSFCAKPEVVNIETDLLLVGGGMACTGAAVEAAAWAKAAGLKAHPGWHRSSPWIRSFFLRRRGHGAVRHQHLRWCGKQDRRLRRHGAHRPHGHHPGRLGATASAPTSIRPCMTFRMWGLPIAAKR